MKARGIIEGSTFDPETLSVVSEAFEKAWSEIAATFGGDARSVEEGRARLAHACLVVAHEGCNDPEQIKADALRVMALAYRKRR
jgi:hypothetical protein